MKKTIRIAFYKPTKSDWQGHLIAGYTALFNWGTPWYSHVELGFKVDGVWKYYSSSSKKSGTRNGTRWISEASLLKHPERWDVYDVEPIRSQRDMISTCAMELSMSYDWLGIFGFATLFGQLNDKLKWYCSEICYDIFFGRWEKRISPRRLYTKTKPYFIKKEGGKT